MIDTDEPHIDADEILWAFVDSLALPALADEEQIGEFPGSDLEAKMPYVAVEVVSGTQDLFESRPTVDVDVFASSRKQAKSVLATITLQLLRYPRIVAVRDQVVTIDEVVCTRSSVKMPWDDEEIRRQSATFQLTVRR